MGEVTTGEVVVQPRIRVLHVDDDPETLAVVAMILDADPGIEVVSCAGPDEARATVATARVDVLLLDVMMPGTDGPGLLAEFRAHPDLAAVPTLFVTARTHPVELEALAATSAIGVVRKPFEASVLLAQVRSCLAARPT